MPTTLASDERTIAMTTTSLVLTPRPRPTWMDHAACSGQTHLFFPPLAERPQARVRREAKARAVCDLCPVRLACRDHARAEREYGYWGGESEEERTAAGYAVPNPIGGRRRRTAVAGDGVDPTELSEAS